MSDPAVTIGFSVIAVLYAGIGLLAAVGSAVIFRTVFGPEKEQLCFGAFLIPIAGFYLAFAAYFEAASSWRTEVSAVLVFSLMGALGIRHKAALAAGYPLHGLWDLVHELSAHGALPQLDPSQLTDIPLAYGIFCLAYDFAIGLYYARPEILGNWARL